MKNINKNINLILASIFILIAIVFLTIVPFVNKIGLNIIFYDKPLKVNDVYELGLIKAQNNFFLPQTITLKNYAFCYKYYYIDKYSKNEQLLFDTLKVLFEPDIKAYNHYSYNTIYYIPLKPYEEKDIKIELPVEEYNNLKQKNATIIIVEKKEYFYCQNLGYNYNQNEYKVLKEIKV